MRNENTQTQSEGKSADARLWGGDMACETDGFPLLLFLLPWGHKSCSRGSGGAQTHQRISGAFGASTSTPRGFDDARDVFQNGSRSARTCRRGLKETEDGLKTVQRAPRRSLEGLKKQNHRLWNCFSMICPFSLFRIEGASRDSRETPRTGPRLSKRAARRPRGFPRWSQGS